MGFGLGDGRDRTGRVPGLPAFVEQIEGTLKTMLGPGKGGGKPTGRGSDEGERVRRDAPGTSSLVIHTGVCPAS